MSCYRCRLKAGSGRKAYVDSLFSATPKISPFRDRVAEVVQRAVDVGIQVGIGERLQRKGNARGRPRRSGGEYLLEMIA